MIEVLYSLLGIGGLAVLIWCIRSVKRWGAAEYKEDAAIKQREAAEESAQAWANKPRSFDAFAERMRKLAKKRGS